MDTPKIQTSFIPQKPATGGYSGADGLSHGILYILGIIIFILSIAACGGVFAYQTFLQGQISSMNQTLSQARQSLQPDLIAQFTTADQRLVSANQILDGHQSVSGFFDLLSQLTLPSVRFTSLDYSVDSSGVEIKMNGQAKSYGIIALQSQTFSDNPLVKSVQFSGFDLDNVGDVTFDLTMTLDPKVVSYKSIIDAANPTAASTTPSSVSSAIATTTEADSTTDTSSASGVSTAGSQDATSTASTTTP